MKKLLFIFTMALMAVSASATVNGRCGANVYYSYDEATQTLTIFGEGPMSDHDVEDEYEWHWEGLKGFRFNCLRVEEGVTHIGEFAFCRRELTSVTLPNSLTSIGKYAFWGNRNLTTITSKIVNPFPIDNSVFAEIPSNAKFIVPNGTINMYKATDGWNIFANIVETTEEKDFVVDGIGYNVSTDENIVVSVDNGMTNVEIPDVVIYNGTVYYVSAIGRAAFHRNSTVETVVLPNSIKSIGEIAFGDCQSLKSINIPNSVTSIGDGAFYGCFSLTSLHIPEGIKRIGNNMFWGCARLTDVTIPQSVTIIDEEAFRECLTLGSITIPGNVDEIGKNAFQKCYKLTDVYCYAEVLPITDNTAFDGTPIESATLHVPASAIDAYKASWPWKNFGEIVAIGTIPEEGEKPDTPDNPEKSGKADFVIDGIGYNVSTDENIVVSVDNGMTDVEIPDLVTYNGTVYYVSAIGSAAFHKNSTVETVVLPNSIKSIGEIAFGDCQSLKSINIPNSVTSIGDGAFYGCFSLTSLHIPEGIKRIGNNMFWGCARLTDVTIPQSVTIIDEEAFRECLTLGSITIPGNVDEIGKNAFQKCYKLTDVYCYAEVLPITDNTAFDGTPIESATLHVPASVIDAYKASWPWRGFKEIVALTSDGIEGVKLSEDGNSVYYDLTGRKVSHPQKGIYIKNGKKVIVK